MSTTESKRSVPRYTREEIQEFNERYKTHPEFKNRGGVAPYDLWKLRQKHANAFKHWERWEESKLVDHLHKGAPIWFIARELGRPVGGIKARIEKLHNSDDKWGNCLLPAVPIDYQDDLRDLNIRQWYYPKHHSMITFHIADHDPILADFRHLNPHIPDQINAVVNNRDAGFCQFDFLVF